MEDKDLYTLAVLKYKEENPNLNIDDLFSVEWNLSKDYRTKVIIISEAINNHIKVEDTPLYKKLFIENSDYNINNK